jgi:hypothetical protein
VCSLNVRGNVGHIAAYRIHIHPVAQACERHKAAPIPTVLGAWVEMDRAPHLHCLELRHANVGREDSDNGVRLIVEHDCLAEDVRAGAVPCAPGVVGEDHDAPPVVTKVPAFDKPAQHWGNAKGTERLGRGESAANAIGAVGRLHDERPLAGCPRDGDARNTLGQLVYVRHRRPAPVAAFAPIGLAERDQAIGLHEGKRAEDNRVDDAEDRRVQTNREGECGDGDGGNTAVCAKHAESHPEVRAHRSHGMVLR